ncbi:MAG TPA: Tad domain-containing protein [Pyrinomonadaceae bacterium]|nr:Tad domain-containing protein [Pyrinomonadaceae bacterium]
MKDQCVANSSHRKSERGSVLAYTVLSVLFLFFAVGLGVDLSHLYLAKTELQNTADAAALAGGKGLHHNAIDERIGVAVDRALMVLNLNKYNFNNKDYDDVMTLEDQRALVRFAVNLSEFDNGGNGLSEAEASVDPENIRFVRVTTPSVPINIFFSIPILGTQRNLNARAVSGLSVPGNVNYCVAPLSAVQCDGPDDPNCPEDFQGTCPNGPPAGCDPTWQFCKGCSYTIRTPGAGGPSAGNYQVLACAGSGAAEVRSALAAYGDNCQCGNLKPGEQVTTEPGVNAGPIAQGLNVRFDIYGGGLTYSTEIPPDSNIAQGTSSGQGANETWSGITWDTYKSGDGAVAPSDAHLPGVTNRRVLIIPIIAESQFEGGRTEVQVGSLGAFFMQHQAVGTNGTIKVEYIGDDVVSVIGLDPNGDTSTNVVTPVLYR